MSITVSLPAESRLLTTLVGLALVVSVLLVAPVARAGVAVCDVEASATSVMVGDQVTFTGTGFAPNTLISVAALANGVPFGAAGGPTDSAGTFVYTIGLPVVGTWLVTFTQENACSDSMTVTVGAAATAGPTTAPSGTGLPDAAMPTPRASGPALVVTLLVWLLLLVFAGAAARRT